MIHEKFTIEKDNIFQLELAQNAGVERSFMKLQILVAGALAFSPVTAGAEVRVEFSSIDESNYLAGNVWPMKLLFRKCGIDEATFPEMAFFNAMMAKHSNGMPNRSVLDADIPIIDGYLRENLRQSKVTIEQACEYARQNPATVRKGLAIKMEKFKVMHLEMGHASLSDPEYKSAAVTLLVQQLNDAHAKAERERWRLAAQETPEEAEARKARAWVSFRTGMFQLLSLRLPGAELAGALSQLTDTELVAKAQEEFDAEMKRNKEKSACPDREDVGADVVGIVADNSQPGTAGTMEELGKAVTAAQNERPGRVKVLRGMKAAGVAGLALDPIVKNIGPC